MAGWQDLMHPRSLFTPPDFVTCDEAYGRNLIPRECYEAADRLPHGENPRDYQVRRGNNPPPYYTIPFSIQEGGCFISIEAAGPTIPSPIRTVPDQLRMRAAETIRICVTQENGLGGFGTYQLSNLFDFLLTRNSIPLPVTIPASTAFVTISVTSAQVRLFSPGDKSAVLPFSLSSDLMDQAERLGSTDKISARDSARRSVAYKEIGLQLLTGSSRVPWWSSDLQTPAHALSNPNEMSYECDVNLGAPALDDCSRIEWEALRPDSDTLQVGPKAATFLHRNTCHVAITASVNLVLTWEQVRVALSALLNVCLQAPVGAKPQGGRAFYAGPRQQISGRGQKKKRQLSGLNALPPHANITLSAK